MAAALNQQFSTLAAMTVDGIVGWKITELARSSSATNMPKAMDTMLFLDSFCRCVLPILRPFPQPNSVLICGAHPASILISPASPCACSQTTPRFTTMRPPGSRSWSRAPER